MLRNKGGSMKYTLIALLAFNIGCSSTALNKQEKMKTDKVIDKSSTTTPTRTISSLDLKPGTFVCAEKAIEPATGVQGVVFRNQYWNILSDTTEYMKMLCDSDKNFSISYINQGEWPIICCIKK